MDRLILTAGDLQRLRFRYSPLVELAGSLSMVVSGQVPRVHRRWYDAVVADVHREVDLGCLRLLAPPSARRVAPFFLAGLQQAGTSVEAGLSALEQRHPEQLRRDLAPLWPHGLPSGGEALLQQGAANLCRVLRDYWEIAVAPFWTQVLGLLEDDIAYRAHGLLATGLEGVVGDLAPGFDLDQHTLDVQTGAADRRLELSGRGLVLVPCAFSWPTPVVGTEDGRAVSIVYGARGIASLWEGLRAAPDAADASRKGALAALLGRNRAAVLVAVTSPRTTTDLARELGQTPPAVNVHLGILRRSGLVTSRRAGRRVLYRATPLAESILDANGALAITASGAQPRVAHDSPHHSR
jgi:DNA-binding transcriptional ArsR family regulator